MLIDVIVVALIAIFFLIGLMQGFLVSVLVMVAWAVGVISVWLFSGYFGAILGANVSLMPPLDLILGGIIAFFIPFLLAKIIISVIKFFMTKTSSITMANRLLGGVWGLVKGLLIAGLLLTVMDILPAKGNFQKTLKQSKTYAIYREIPFNKLWDKFKLPKEIQLYI